MDIQDWVTKQIDEARSKRMLTSPQITLGELISKIKPIVDNQKNRESKEEATVRFDFEYLFPTELDSWRGSYAELALNFKSEGNEMTVTAFYNMLKEAIGKEFTGYKGGEFIMNEDTPVWVANYGNSGSTAVVEVVDNGHTVILITQYCHY